MSNRRLCVIGYWLMFIGIVMLCGPDAHWKRGLLATSGGPLFMLAYFRDWMA